MTSRDVELKRLKQLVKLLNKSGLNARTTRRSGGIRGLGGDIVSREYLFEEKPGEMMTKAGMAAREKIEEESIQRGKIPVLIHGGLITFRLSDGILELRE